jgi:hypothetical protein
MADAGCRDEMAVATKFAANYRTFEQEGSKEKMVMSNFRDNGGKSLKLLLQASLKKTED